MSLESSSQIRKRILAQCRNLSPETASSLSAEICSRFLKVSGLGEHLGSGRKGLSVALYRALPGEVKLDVLEAVFQQLQWNLFYPRVVDKQAIEFIQMSSSSAWAKGRFGISEPHSELKVSVSLEDLGKHLDLVLVPGVAFGPNGERLGKGLGHYDRFLAHVPQALRVALAFDFQVLSGLEQNSWDQSVHWIITEKREVRARNEGFILW